MNKTTTTTPAVRDSNMELFRITAMLFVMIFHVTGEINLMNNDQFATVNPLEYYCNLFIVAATFTCVDLFILLSGWYGIKTKTEKLLSLLYQVLFYSIPIYFVILLLFPDVTFSLKFLIHILLMDDYWFVPVYIMLFLIAPVLNPFIEQSTKRQFTVVLVSVITMQCIFGWINDRESGYLTGCSPISFVILYLLGAYLRRFEINKLFSKRQFLLSFVALIVVQFIIAIIAKHTENIFFVSISWKFSSIVVILASACLLMYFSKIEIGYNKTINWIAASSFAAFLVHCHPYFYEKVYEQVVVTVYRSMPYYAALPLLLLFVAVLFALCVLVDKARIASYRFVRQLFKKEMSRTAAVGLLLLTCGVAHAQLYIGGRQAPYDRLTNTYLVSVPESFFNQNITLSVKKPSEYKQMLINGSNVSSDIYTFNYVDANSSYIATFIHPNGIAESSFIKFTFLPILQLKGTFGYNYRAGSVLMFEPDKTTVDTLDATIKWRGGSTNGPDKHKRNYKIKLTDDKRLFGMRNDNNWILDAGQADIFRLRNRVAMDIWNAINSRPYYAEQEPKARLGVSGTVVEVFLNDEYMGFYNFSENLDRKQTKIKKVDAQTGDIRGCLYKAKGWGYALMYDTLYTPYSNLSEQWSTFEVNYPDLADSDTTDWSTLYNAIDFVVMSSAEEFKQKVDEYFDVPVLVDYCVFGSALNALDNYGKNMIWAVYDKTFDKKLTPAAWDLDCTVGQEWAGQFNKDFLSPRLLFDMSFGLTNRLILFDVDHFVDKLNARYQELRQTVLNTDSLISRYRYYYDLITRSGAARREMTRWSGDSDIRGELMSFDYEINYISNWITRHLREVDRKGFPLSLEIPAGIPSVATVNEKPNAVYDLSGRRVNDKQLKPGIYIIAGRKMVVK